MNSRRMRLARLRSTSTDLRSRSVTPNPERVRERPSAARRALYMGLVAECVAREETDDETQPLEVTTPRRPKTFNSMVVDRTPGGSLHVTKETVPVQRTPGGRIRCVPQVQSTDDVPLCSDILERVEAMDVSDEEADELLTRAPWHVQRWIKGLGNEGQGCSLPVVSSATAEEDLVTTGQDSPAVPCVGANIYILPEIDVRPSTSGVTSRPVARQEINIGSDFDSEFDDEFDITPVEAAAFIGVERGIPANEELEEPVRAIINDVERAMDDEADRLLGELAGFTWEEGFESFRGVPEQFSGPTPGPLKDYDSPYDAFTDIWDNDIMERIAQETNRYAKQTIDSLKARGELKRSSRMHEWTDTNADELMVLFGVFMYMAIDARTSQAEYWKSNDYLELHEFKRLMTYNRYILLCKFLHFVDNNSVGSQNEGTSTARYSSARLSKLAPILEHLGQKFNSLYNLGQNVSIDESLTLFKGRLSWVQTIRSKAARFGIKSYELCESQTGYMAGFQIYTGKSDSSRRAEQADPSLGVDLGGKSTKVVLELLQGLERRGHCVTMDNFYNSPSLARYLKRQGFDCLGTLRTCRRNVPSEIAKVPKNVRKGTIISRHCGDVSIVSWKDSKMVSIISTFHDDTTYVGSKAGKTLVKPVCVRDYNRTMGGVDLKDQKLSMYLLERKRGVKWYIKLFKRLLNVSIHNALVMYVSSLKRRNKLAVTHREFRYELAKSVVDKHRLCPLQSSAPVDKLMRLRRDIVHVPKYFSGNKNRSRCVICQKMNIRKMVHMQCKKCEVFLCFEDCWEKWHTLEKLEGREKCTRGRKRTREESTTLSEDEAG